jgi:probable F420-dependent oxidoreductase
MKFGIQLFLNEQSMRPDDFARAAEERGFESIFLPEHTHIPVERRSPFIAGGELPQDYYHTYDPFVTLTAAAVATKKLRLGTGVCLVVEHDPIVLAKTVATLDVISNGRLILGVGAGWNAEEMENHATVFKTRWKLLRERVEAMKAIWHQQNPQYHGEFVNFAPIWSFPKPTQKPNPPVLLGGHGDLSLRRVVRYCDGWIPVEASIRDIKADIKRLHQLAEEAGRDPKTISVTVTLARPNRERIDLYAEAGVERVVYPLPTGGEDVVLPRLDRHAKLIERG